MLSATATYARARSTKCAVNEEWGWSRGGVGVEWVE